ncbi:hypothetical protein H6F67_26730 [Microcoleus sp. FACHB-1515]|uniref:hypothetical protein n=1 Tax=Cyanophyceae TaxID=3028117 RepID=UPI0016840774|nr:hypothetical protein [Microcoleus sp. FACHB-1515]MBD2093440.1 hypothetical protein [Microcoleus sp. FACHB-1515]
MFGVSDHSAEKLRHDINTILEAIARLLAKVELPKAEQPLPPVQMRAELELEDPDIVTDAEVIEEPNLLIGVEQDLLTGRDRLAVPAIPPPALLEPETQAQVQLQIGNTHIRALLPDGLRSQLEQLPPEQIEALRQAMTQPASGVTNGHTPAEVIDLQIDGIQRLHQTAQGQITVNNFYSIVSKMQAENMENSAQSSFLQIDRGQYTMLLNQEMSEETAGTLYFSLPEQDDFLYEYEGDIDEALDDLPEIYQEAQQRSIPHLELRPAAEVEALIGQELSDSSAVHQQVLNQAPLVQVAVDQAGQIKPGSYLRDQIEPTEDEVEREQLSEPSLTPEAAIVIDQIWDYFDRTGA